MTTLYVAHYSRNLSRKGSPVTFRNVYQVPEDEIEEVGYEPTNSIRQYGPVFNNVAIYSGVFDSEAKATAALQAHLTGEP